MNYIPIFFIFAFLAVPIFLKFYAWVYLEKKYNSTKIFKGKRLGIFTGTVRGVNYKNCLVLYFDENGLYIKALKLFPLFHKPVYIPWNKWKVYPFSTFFKKNYHHLICNDPVEVSFLLNTNEFEVLKKFISLS